MINIGDILSRQARMAPDRQALVFVPDGRTFTYLELNAAVDQTANALLHLGIGKGDRVALLMANCPEFVQCFFALGKIGAVAVPVNWRLRPSEVGYIVADSGAKALVYSHQLAETASALESELPADMHWLYAGDDAPEGGAHHLSLDECVRAAPGTAPELNAADDDLLFIMYTSGTTGMPKGVMHSHKTIFWALTTLTNSGDFRQDDRYYSVLPLFHVGALTPLLLQVHRSATTLLDAEFNPARTWEIIADGAVTASLFVPAMLLALRQTWRDDYDLSRLRWIISGAAPVPLELIRDYMDRGIPIVQIYGLTETAGPACIQLPGDAARSAGSTGRAMLYTDVRIVDSDGRTCAPGERGELLIRGGHIMQGYWNQPEATQKAIVDGWLHSGDVAVLDEDGFVHIVDRAKDIIISGGENIAPAEIENVLTGMEAVVEAAVIGVPSERWGESPMAVVVKNNPELTEKAIVEEGLKQLARYKKIGAVRFVDQLPHNATGKVLKHELRKQFADVQLP